MSPDYVRRSGRLAKEIAIVLIGSDMEGKVFSEQTNTVVLSRHGAGIVSQQKLAPEQELIIRRLDTNQETELRIVGQIGTQADSYTYGAAFVDSNVNFWGVDFPPLTPTEKEAVHWVLECISCKDRETLDHSDVASDVYAINEGIVRYCNHCGFSTVWKRAFGPAPEPAPKPRHDISVSPTSASQFTPQSTPQSTQSLESAPPPAASLPAGSAPAGNPENRRKHRRTKVNCSACVRHLGFGEDIVACEDMSRGGLRFKSRNRYLQREMIEVAVPYSPGAHLIFAPAQIVFVQELPDQKLYRYGVAYTKSS